MTSASTLDSFRAKAAEYRRKADEIERHIEALEALAGDVLSDVSNVRARAPSRTRGTGQKGKAPGTISMRWREHFAAFYADVGKAPFDIDIVQKRLKRTEGRDAKPSEIHRLFKNHVSHGYLVRPSREKYQITEKMVDLIGLETENPSVKAEGSNVGDVAERSIASGSKSDGAAPEKPAPVGSNPTVSAPVTSERASHPNMFVPYSTNPQPNG